MAWSSWAGPSLVHTRGRTGTQHHDVLESFLHQPLLRRMLSVLLIGLDVMDPAVTEPFDSFAERKIVATFRLRLPLSDTRHTTCKQSVTRTFLSRNARRVQRTPMDMLVRNGHRSKGKRKTHANVPQATHSVLGDKSATALRIRRRLIIDNRTQNSCLLALRSIPPNLGAETKFRLSVKRKRSGLPKSTPFP